VSDLSLSLPQPSSLSSHFLSPVQLRRGSDRAVLVGTWHLSKITLNSKKRIEKLMTASFIYTMANTFTVQIK